MAYYVYLLRCGDGSLYGGIATDPKRREEEHKAGTGAKYTRAHGAQYMERVWLTKDRSDASKLEYAVKHLRKEQKERLVEGFSLSDAGINVPAIDCGKGYPDKLAAAKIYCKNEYLLTADLYEAIHSGVAEVVAANEKGLLTYLPYSKIYQLCADDYETADLFAKEMTEPWDMVVTHHEHEERALNARFSLSPMERVRNAVYRKKTPPVPPATDAIIEPMGREHLPFILSLYSLYDAEEEIKRFLNKKEILGAFVDGRPVGFIGFHDEGTMGMLEIAPDRREKGYGTALLCAQISIVLKKKQVPLGQIFVSNLPSLGMHEKLGFSFSEPTIRWHYRQ